MDFKKQETPCRNRGLLIHTHLPLEVHTTTDEYDSPSRGTSSIAHLSEKSNRRVGYMKFSTTTAGKSRNPKLNSRRYPTRLSLKVSRAREYVYSRSTYEYLKRSRKNRRHAVHRATKNALPRGAPAKRATTKEPTRTGR